MADAKNSSATETNYLSMFTPAGRAAFALEIAQEISEEGERLYAVASALVDRLTPQEGQDADDLVALRLAETLRNMLSDHAQHYLLDECLEAMRSDLQKAAAGVVA